MQASQAPMAITRVARRTELCSYLSTLSVSGSRSISYSSARYATPTLHPENRLGRSTDNRPGVSARTRPNDNSKIAQPSYKELTVVERAEKAAERARLRLQEQQQKFANKQQLGGLAENSVFHDDEAADVEAGEQRTQGRTSVDLPISKRDISSMSVALNPRPNARARWQRKMVIRHVRRRGRLPREVQIARTEREHLAKSHFFKTSVKKLAPLARQIAGKPIDQAILQMRFSKKKAAIEVRKHLIQARDEAIVMRGLGLPSSSEQSAETSTQSTLPVITDPATTPALAHQNPTKSLKPGVEQPETDIYVAQAWVGRGTFTPEPEFRARGRVNLLKHPTTSLSVVLKEEKTRIREKAEKEAKTIRKRLGKQMWTQLPDRPIIRQSQYVLW